MTGAEYGEPGQRGVSPTEEEFEEALRSGLPILALVQAGVDRKPRQQEFVKPVRGTWEEGRFAPTFTNSTARCRAPYRQRDVEAVIAAARASGLINQPVAGREAERRCRRQHPDQVRASRGFEQFEVVVDADGAVIAEGPVGGSRDATVSLGWMVVMHDRIPGAVSQGLRFTEAVWRDRHPRRHRPSAPVRRQDLTLPENATRLQAEIRRRFEAAGAVNAG